MKPAGARRGRRPARPACDALGGLNKPQDGMQGRIRVRSYDISALQVRGRRAAARRRRRAAVPRAGRGGCVHGRRRASPRWWSRRSRAGRAIRARDVHRLQRRRRPRRLRRRAVRDRRRPWQRALSDDHVPCRPGRRGDRALAAVGEFKAINELMAARRAATRRLRLPARGRDPAAAERTRREWRVNVTQIRNAAGQAMNAVDARQLSDGESRAGARSASIFRFLRPRCRASATSAHRRDRAAGRHPRNAPRRRPLRSVGRGHPSSAPISTTPSASMAGRWRCMCAGRVEWGFFPRRQPRLLPAAVPHAGAAAACPTCWWPAAARR